MRKIIICTLLIGSFIIGTVDASVQCDCIGGKIENDYRGSHYRTAYEEFQHSDIVFVGEYIEMKKMEIPPPYKAYNFSYEYEIKFRVKSAWKKRSEELITVRIEAGCLIGFTTGSEYLVYAFTDKKKLRINYCSRTKLLAKSSADLKEFEEKGEKPLTIIGSPPKK
jgi:hypothetical protein